MLRPADLEQSGNTVLHSLVQPSSQESGSHAIDEFIGWVVLRTAFGFARMSTVVRLMVGDYRLEGKRGRLWLYRSATRKNSSGSTGANNSLRIVDATLARPRFLFGRPRSTYPCSSRSAAGLDRTEQTSYQPPHERRGTCNNSLPLGP